MLRCWQRAYQPLAVLSFGGPCNMRDLLAIGCVCHACTPARKREKKCGEAFFSFILLSVVAWRFFFHTCSPLLRGSQELLFTSKDYCNNYFSFDIPVKEVQRGLSAKPKAPPEQALGHTRDINKTRRYHGDNMNLKGGQGGGEERLIIKPLKKISSFCSWKPSLNPPFSHVLAQRLTNTPRRNLQEAMGRKLILHAYRHNPLCCNEGLINVLYIFNLGFFFSAGHEIYAFANPL